MAHRIFGYSPSSWERHANRWSFWTRAATLPFLLAAIWSINPLGWWGLALVAVEGLWLWVNPFIFPRPHTNDTWEGRAVLGERIWLAPQRYRVDPQLLQAPRRWMYTSGAAFLLAVFGALTNAPLWAALFGAVSWATKMRFLHHMVHLYNDTAKRDPQVASWLY